MVELGYDVDIFCQDPKLNLWDKVCKGIVHGYELNKSIEMQKRFIDSLENKKVKYDFIFVIKGDKLEANFLKRLKELNPNAKMVLYLWDDIKRIPNFFSNRMFFDKIYTFDRYDMKEYNLEFLPLFFCKDFVYNDNKKTIDVYFSGWDHSDRREILERMRTFFLDNHLNYYYYIYTGRGAVFRRKLKQLDFKKEPEYIKYKTLSLDKNAELTKSSKVLIDIQHPSQKGLTMRTFEALASKSKLITTNKDIMNYDFYTSDNIAVIDRENPMIDLDFFISPYQEIGMEIVEKYSLENWVKTIFNH